MSTVFHILTETEPFSEYRGGAISRWTANVLRDDSSSVILAPSADESWGFARERIQLVPGLARYRDFRGGLGRYCPPRIRQNLLSQIFRGALGGLRPGDLVWMHNRPEFALALQPVVHRAGARLVLHMHNSHLLQWDRAKFTSACIDELVFCSQYLRGEAEARFGPLANASVLHNGADDRLFHPREQPVTANRIPTILVASRLVPEKGVHVFAEAMRILETRSVQAVGIVIGASGFGGSRMTPYIRQLQNSAPSNLLLQDYCVGPALAEKFRSADVFCLPSVWNDPFPLAPLEAMASALPVVATRSGGIPEALAHGGGLLVDRNSAPELASALQLLIEDPALRARVGRAGYDSFRRHFTWAAVQHQYSQLASSFRLCSDLSYSA